MSLDLSPPPDWATLLFALLAAPALGSFAGLLSARLPRGEGWVTARSRCESCGRILGPAELIPIVSFALLKGRCRGCRAPIPRRALLAELAVLALTLHAATVLSGWPLIAAAVLAALLVALTLTDLEARIIPDEINGMLALAGLCVIWARAETVLWHHLAAGAGGALFFWLLAEGYGRLRGRDVLGGGDVKFLGAAGLWTGPLALPTLLVWASASGLLAAGIAALRGARIGPDTEMPFGPFLAAGLWLAWLYGPIGM